MQKPPIRLVVEGFRPASEAVVGTAAMRYLPFEVPLGVTKISVAPLIHDGPASSDRNTVDLGLFDERGPENGFRGWQGGTRKPFDVTGSRDSTSPPFLPGPIHPGTWYLAQYFLKAAPSGLRYRYEIVLSFDGPPPGRAAIPAYRPAARRNATGWYAGNLHCHSQASDGAILFADLVRRIEAAGFDFMVSTEHNTPAAHYDFAASARPDLLMIEGDEITTPSGHAGVIGQKPGDWYDFRTQAGDGGLPARIAKAHRQGAIFVIDHPFQPCTTCSWSFPPEEWKGADGVEVWNGGWDATDQAAVTWWDEALRAGERLNAYGGSDFHRDTDPMEPACFVRSSELSRAAILDGLRKGRTCISASPRGPRLELSLDGSETGRTVLPSTHAELVCEAFGASRDQELILLTGNGEVSRQSAITALRTTIDTSGSRFVRAELRNSDGTMAALTNAIFVARR